MKSRIGFVASNSDFGKSGVGHYEIQLFSHILRHDTEDDFVLIAREDALPSFPPPSERLTLRPYASKYEGHLANLIWHHTKLPRIAKQEKLDLLHLSTQQRMMSRKPCKLVATIHDLGGYHVKHKYGRLRDFYMKRLGRFFAKKLDHVITVSNFSKNDIINFFGIPADRITVAYSAVDFEVFRPLDKQECREQIARKHGFREPFIVYVARLDHPSKNHVTLLKAYSILRKKYGVEHKLFLGGSKWFSADVIFQTAEDLGLKDHVIFAGFVPNEDLPVIYSAADLEVFPTLFEGFGVPPLEAMACGTPVACSNVSAVPEVVGDAAVLFDPLSPEEIASAVNSILSNADLRGNLIKKGFQRARLFTWEEDARRTVEVYRKVLGK
jgi:glycosyltransferase involved in cell wall biosynthesis